MKLMKNLMVLAAAFTFVFIVDAEEAKAYPGYTGGHTDDISECFDCHNSTEDAMTDYGSCVSACHEPYGLMPEAGHGDTYGQNCLECHEENVPADDADYTTHATSDCASCHEGAGTYDPTAKSHSDHITDDNVADCLGCHNTATETPEAPDLTDCLGCHSQSGTDGDDNATVGDGTPEPAPPGHGNDMGQNCAQCHETQMADAGHASNDCATCHEGAGTYDPDAGGGGTEAPAAPPDHNTTHMGGFANNVGADNAEGGSCDSCHTVHGSEDGDYLTKDVNNDNKSQSEETCLQCHEDKVGTEGHPYKTDCASCHNIHAMSESDTTTDYSDPVVAEDCLSCHPSVSSTPGMESHTYTTNCTGCHSTEAVKPED